MTLKKTTNKYIIQCKSENLIALNENIYKCINYTNKFIVTIMCFLSVIVKIHQGQVLFHFLPMSDVKILHMSHMLQLIWPFAMNTTQVTYVSLSSSLQWPFYHIYQKLCMLTQVILHTSLFNVAITSILHKILLYCTLPKVHMCNNVFLYIRI